MDVELKEVEPDDPAAVALVEAARVEIVARGADDSGGKPRKPVAEVMRTDLDIVVAYDREEPVGVAALRTFGPGIGEIRRIYVAPAYRGAGVARRLLAELERRAREHGFEAVRLDTHDRLTEANRLYRSAGYREIPDYNGNPRVNRWFEKLLA
jgi:ribosomal protein S18 acetylase RimI-like enzyme